MVAYVVRNSEDAKVIALVFGMDVPEGRGRFPINRLVELVESKGDTLDVSQYGTSTNVPVSNYLVTALVTVKGKFEVERAIVSSVDVRNNIGKVVRGRLSQSDIGATAANLNDWKGYDVVTVERL